MATTGRRADPPLEQVLFEEPFLFEFFQAVRLLSLARPGRIPVGRDGPPDREVVRFLARLELSFPASPIHSLVRAADPEAPPEMTVSFFGLIGALGVLPYHYSELLIERVRAGDGTLAGFLDMFHHRLISLFYRAWEKYHFLIPYERGEGDRFSQILFALIGLGPTPLRGRHDFADNALLFYTGLLARRQRPAVVMESLLRDFFQVPIVVEQFVGRWLKLDPADRSVMGASDSNNQLGISMVVGDRVWDEQGRIRVRVGPLSFDQFRDYLPDGGSFRSLSQMARLYVDGELDIDIQPVLRAEDVPACRLSSAPGQGAMLGRYAWLISQGAERDADDAVFAAVN